MFTATEQEIEDATKFMMERAKQEGKIWKNENETQTVMNKHRKT